MTSLPRTTARSGSARFPAHRRLLVAGAIGTLALAATLLWLATAVQGDPQRTLRLAALVVGIAGPALFLAIDAMLRRWVDHPVQALAAAAEAIAAGNLEVPVVASGGDEVARLGHAMARMVGDLQRLARALGQSSDETTRLATEILSLIHI